MKKIYFCLLLLASLLNPGFMRAQAELWGVTTAGGDGFGSLFSMPTGSTGFSFQRNFAGAAGSSPQHTKLIQASNGKLYGTLLSGGANNLGVLFEYDASTNLYTKRYDFSTANGSSPRGPLMQASNGKLYGMTQGGGANGVGVLYEYDISTNTYTKKIDLSTTNGSQAFGALVEPGSGKLYGVTRTGGANSGGAIFEYDLSTAVYTKKADMSASTGTLCFGDLVLANNGMLYGLAAAGGTNSGGTIFEYDYTGNTVTKKFDLGGTNGASPNGSLYKASDGNLYGMTTSGGANSSGAIFQYSVSNGAFAKIYDFTVSTGSAPSGNVIQGTNGKLYGMARTGGANGNGVIFEFDISGSVYTKKFDLQSSSTVGGNPFGTLLQASNGKLYGLTNTGGISGAGVLFEYDLSSSTYTRKIDLNYAPNGGAPNGGPVYAGNGKIYGTTISGGTNNVGVIYEYDKTTSTYTKKVDMLAANGSVPYGSMVEAPNGKLYGLTNAGGANALGVLYEYDYTTNTYTKQIDLSATTGNQPFGNLMLASNGKLYGITRAGGANSLGTLFEYSYSTNTFSKTVDLTSANGSQPSGSLVEASGKLYGMTQNGGANSIGTIFEYDLSTNTYTKKIDLTAALGQQPLGSLVLADDGKLYGLTRLGGTNNLGTVIQYDIAGNTCTKMADLSTTTGSSPQGSLIKAASGRLYGLTQAGGTNSLGTLVDYNTSTATLTKLIDLSLTTGSLPGYTRLLEVCPKPAAPASISASTGSLCQGSTSMPTYSVAAVATATSYAWTLPSGAAITSGSLTNNISASYSNVASGVFSYSVGGVNACGLGSLAIGSITINATPTISASGGTICSGSSFTINPGGGSSYVYSSGSNVVSPTSVTNYTVSGSSAAGCAGNSVVVTVNVNALPVVTASASSNSVCAGGTVIVTGGGASSYAWTGGVSNGVAFTPGSTQTYTVTGTDGNGCQNTATRAVTVSPLPIVTASASSNAICIGGAVILTGGGASSYAWTGGVSNGSSFSPTITQSYTVTGTASSGCQNTATKIVTVNPLPVVTASASSNSVCAGSTVILTGGGATSYAWTGGVSNGVAFTPGSTQTYTVTGTDGNGCQNTATRTVTVNALPAVTASASSNSVCAGSTVILTGGGASTYAWTGGVSNGVAFTPGSTQTYTVTGTDGNGCQNTATRVVTVTPLPIVTASASSNAVCVGGTVILTGGGASSYAWTGGVSNGSSFSPTITQSYTVTGTASSGCQNTATKIVTVNPLPVVTASASSNSVCAGSTVILTGGGATSYAWTGGVSNGVAFTPGSTQTYTVTGTDGNGCQNTATRTVTVNALPAVTASASSNAVCAGSTVILTGGGASTYVWTGGVSNGVAFTPGSTQTYTVTGTDGNGCQGAATRVVTVNPLPTISGSASSPVICSGGTTSLNGSGASTYTWASVASGTIANGASFAPSATASYTVAGTSAAGCLSSNFPVVTVTVNPLPVITVNSGTICAGSSFTISPGGASSYIVTGNQFVVSPATTTSYSVTGTSSNGCVSANPAVSTVSVFALPVVSVSGGTLCSGQAFTLNPSLSTGSALSYTYSGDVSQVSSSSIVVTPTANATYSVLGTNVNGCVSASAGVASLIVNPTPSLTALNGTICSGDAFTPTVTGAGSYTFSFSGSTVSPVATSIYSVTGSNSFNCVSQPAQFTVTVNALPVVGISGSSTVCIGSSLTLTASGATSYSWGSSTGSLIVVTPSANTVYTVTGTDSNNCSAVASLSVSTEPTPTITANNGAICPGNSYTIVPSGASSYTFSGGSAVITPSTTGTYSITGTNSLGCVSPNAAVITVSVVNVLTVTISGNLAICIGQSASLTANGASTYSWNTGANAGAIVVTPSASTSYTVVGASGTCSDSAFVNVTVNQLPVITAAVSSVSICVNETATLTASGAGSYTWEPGTLSGNPVSVTPGVTTMYTVTGTDANGCSNSSAVPLVVDLCLGVGEQASAGAQYFVYPNPNLGTFVIECPVESSMTVHNALGEVIVSGSLHAGKNSVDLGEHAKGVYFVKVGAGGHARTIKVVKQ